MWQHCPFASAQVLALDPPERPVCAYESAEYEAALQEFETDDEKDDAGGPSSVLADSKDDDRPRWNLALPDDEENELDSAIAGSEGNRDSGNGFSLLTFSFSKEKVRHHNLALLQVMVSRAAAALSVTAFTDDVISETDRYHLQTTKVHAALEAFLRLSREHRATLAQYHRDQARERKAQADANNTNGHVP